MTRYVFFNILLLLGLCGAVFAETETEYFAIYMGGGKVGYGVHSREATPEKVVTSEIADITISRMGTAINVRQVEKSIETPSGRPVGFESTQQMSMMTQKVVGKIDPSGNMTITTESSLGQKQTTTMNYPADALMAESMRKKALKHGLKPGTQWSAKVFSPGLMQTMDTHIQIGEKKTVDLLGRVVELTEVITTMSTPMGTIKSTTYVDDEFDALKSILPVMGMEMELVACDEAFAKSENDVVEFFNRVVIASPSKMPATDNINSITYTLKPKGSEPIDIPETDNQTAKTNAAAEIQVTVEPLKPQSGQTFPYSGQDSQALKALKANRYLQSDNPRVVELAKKAVGNETDSWRAAKSIEKFVHKYITGKNLSVGYATAAEVVSSQQGDCTEHAVLTAAMCRAVKIPARVATGVVYAEGYGHENGIFGPHAWSEVYINGKWIGLDATRANEKNSYGAGHITLAVGDGKPEDFFSLINTLGYFQITKITPGKD